MEGIIAYALSKKYTQKSLDGLGALKGAPCVIKETKIVDGGTEVTFEWTGISGATETQTILVKNGEDGEQGNGVAKVEKIKSVDLVDTYRMTFTDGSTFDYEVANGDSSLGGKINIINNTPVTNVTSNPANVTENTTVGASETVSTEASSTSSITTSEESLAATEPNTNGNNSKEETDSTDKLIIGVAVITVFAVAIFVIATNNSQKPTKKRKKKKSKR